MDCISFLPTTSGLGVEVSGLDLSIPLKESQIDELNKLLYEYHLIYFGKQSLTIDKLRKISLYFGKPDNEFPLNYVNEKNRNIFKIEGNLKLSSDFVTWHKDSNHLAVVLHAEKVPNRGGDTLWTNMTAAYDALSDRLKAFLEGLEVTIDCHSHFTNLIRRGFASPDHPSIQQMLNQPIVTFPAVIEHPRTGRKVFGFTPTTFSYFRDLPESESGMIMDYLRQHVVQPQFIYRHRWKCGDLIVWDDAGTMHTAVYDYSEPRLLHRASISMKI